jgi:hypothetical protein
VTSKHDLDQLARKALPSGLIGTLMGALLMSFVVGPWRAVGTVFILAIGATATWLVLRVTTEAGDE